MMHLYRHNSTLHMNSKTLSSQDIWNVVHMFFQENTIASPQIESYEAFIDHGMTNVVRESLDITYEIKSTQKLREFDYCTVTIHIDEIKAEDKTRQLPNACRLQNTTYCIQLIIKGLMTVRMYRKKTNMQEKEQLELFSEMDYPIENQELCKLPLLLNSKYCSLYKPNCNEQQIRQHRIFKDECPFDEGGYFIVNGSEKAIVAREANRSNRITVLEGNLEHNELVKATIVSQIAERSMYCKAVVKLVEKKDVITSEDEENEAEGKLKKNQGSKTLLKLQLQGEDQPIDLIPVLISLWPGDTLSPAQVLDIIDPSRDPEVIAVARQSFDYAAYNQKINREDAREYFRVNLKTIVMNATSQNDMQDSKAFDRYLCTRLLPHVGITPEDNLAKAAFLGYMAQQCILCHLGKRPFDDRDHWGSKRLQLTGGLMQDLFRRCYQDFQGLLVKELSQRKIYDNKTEFKRQLVRAAERSITREFITSLATGNWRTGKIGQKVGNQTGVSQNLVRLSYAAAISQIRRTASDIEESSKAVAPRMLHSSQFGYLCPAETPEGGKVGLVKNFTLQCKISVENGAETEKVYQEITQYRTTIVDSPDDEQHIGGKIALRRIDQADGRMGVKVFFNGKWLGCVSAKDAVRLSDHLKKCRAASQIYYQTSIAYNEIGGELVVATDAGRVLRPLFVIRSGLNHDKSSPAYQLVEYCELACKPSHINKVMNEQFGWTSLIRNKDRLIEYLDPYEEEQTLICSDLQEFKLNQERVRHIQRWAKNKQENKGNSVNIQSHNLGTLPLSYTHMEIHPCLILSAISALIPFPDHNQAPRNLFQASMGKQAIGIYALNFQRRFDTQGINVLHSPQRPIGQTRTMKYVKFTDLPAGMNLIVAIAIYTGFNQEDSLIMSQAAVDRGLMRCTYYLSHEAICDPEDVGQDKSGLVQKIMIPSYCRPSVKGQIDKYDVQYLDYDGIPPVGQAITRGRIVIGKVTPCKNMQGEIGTSGRQFQDESVLTKGDEIGYIDSVVLARDKLTHDQMRDRNSGKGEQNNITNMTLGKSSLRAASLTAKVRVRQDRPPQLGDKFSSRHGQKGTVGMLYRHEDLPYTWEGVTPDIIVNPHAIPSRMTIGQLLECVGAKVGARLGGSVDCTPFEPPGGIGTTIENMGNDDDNDYNNAGVIDEQQLKNNLGGVSGVDQESYLTERLFQCGYQRTGYEAMFCGFTGKILNYRIFIGPTFYQRLKHITLDKVSARSTGQVTIKYRQPVEGRSRGGGMRIGEMERDAFLAHGASAVLRDRTMFSSDVAQYLVCRTCGMIMWHADASLLTTKYVPNCAVCKDEAEFAIIRIPHVCKQLFLEIMAMGVLPKLKVSVE